MGTHIFLGNPPANVEQWIKNNYGPKLDEPLCFTAKQANSTVKMVAEGAAPTVSLEYSTDGNTWSPFKVGTTTVTLANIGDNVYIRANIDNTGFTSAIDNECYNYFVITGTVSVSGNIMTLLKADGSVVNLVNSTNVNAFSGLFENCSGIVNASGLLLPSSTSSGCYNGMFSGCTSLTQAPKLPATTLADYCYNSMFSGCTSLTSAPELPATTLASNCYANMFRGCTSLTSAPKLPATTLANNCYYFMFQRCRKLSSIDVSFTAWDPTSATTRWVDGVAASGTFTCPAELPDTRGVNNIPAGWTIVRK